MSKFSIGQIVRNPQQPGWGIGKIVEIKAPQKIRVYFTEIGPRLLDLAYAPLETVESGTAVTLEPDLLQPLRTMDISRVRALCEQFISQMENRRSNCDDAGVARLILQELETAGKLTKTTYKRLASWCHTDYSYREGIGIAENISLAIYGRIIGSSDLS